MVDLTQYRCTNCEHIWVPRKANPQKCPRCQAFSGFGPVVQVKNPNARQFLWSVTDSELKTLRDVLQIMREDFQGCRARIMDMVGMFQVARKRAEGKLRKVGGE